MTENVFGDAPTDGIDPLSTDHVVTLVQYLASPESANVTGQVFVVYGPQVTLMAAPTVAQRFAADGDAWDREALSDALTSYFSERDLEEGFSAKAALAD